jgi:hypothetical protein
MGVGEGCGDRGGSHRAVTLDANVTSHVDDAVRIKAREFDEALAMRFLDIDSKLAMAGASGGSRHTLQFIVACRESLRSRADYIFYEIQRALALDPQPFDATLYDNLRALHKKLLGAQCTSLEETLVKRSGARAHISVKGQLDEERERLESKYALELGVFVRAARRPAAPTGHSDVHIHGNVGALLTGSHASAVVTMNVGDDSREALCRALDLAAAAIRDSQQLAEEAKRQLTGVIEQARAAGTAQPPNPSILRGLFTVLCETLQTLADASPAMAALRVAAQPFGIYF